MKPKEVTLTNVLRKRVFPVLFAIVLALVATPAIGTVRALPVRADATSQAVVGMPFTGNWAYNVLTTAGCGPANSQTSHPSCHMTNPDTGYLWGDWATDIFAAEGTAVKLDVTYPTSGVTFSWGSSSTSCGQSTLVNVLVNGTQVGSIYFAHLNNAVTSGAITNGMTVGNVHDWGGCNPGPHVHVELKNTSNHACYVNYSNSTYAAGMNVDYGSNFGVLGSTNTGVQQACSSMPSGNGTTSASANWSGNFATSWGLGRLDIFTRGSSNNVSHFWYSGGWGPWDSMPVLSQLAKSWPSAVSWGSGRIDLFATAPNGNLLQAYYDGSWHNWAAIGGADTCIVGAPGVSSWGPGRLDVFAQLCYDNGVHLAHIYYDGVWHGWEYLPVSGYQMASAPSAVSWGSGRIDVFAQSTNVGRPIQAYFDSSGWHGWVPLGDANTCITGAPGVSTWGVNRLDLFAHGCNGNPALFHAYFNGGWSGWETLQSAAYQFTGSPSAVSWDVGRIDVFAPSTSGHLLHRWWSGGGWSDWEDFGGQLAT